MKSKNAKGTVFVTGCFDLLHVGHIRFLKKASRYGEKLCIALGSDTYARNKKGDRRPIIPQGQRKEMLLALRWVDDVVVAHNMKDALRIAKKKKISCLIIDKGELHRKQERKDTIDMFKIALPGLRIVYIESGVKDVRTSSIERKIVELAYKT